MKNYVKDDAQEKEIRKYQKKGVPSWIVVLLLKYWAAAAAVFFSLIGGVDIGMDFSGMGDDPAAVLSSYISTVIFLGLFLALFFNYIVKPIVNMMHTSRNNVHRFNMVNMKGVKSLPVALAYNMLLSIILFFVTIFLSKHHLVLDLFGNSEGSGIEPFTYALCYMVVDFIFLFIKNLCIDLYQKYKYNKDMQEVA